MAVPGKPRGEYAKSAERREEILQAGVDVFSTSGFRGGSLRDVADRAGLSQAGVLHHFGSKNELLQAVLSRRDDEARTRMSGDPYGPMPTGLELLRAYVELTEYNASTPGLTALYAVLSAEATAEDHPAHGYFQDRYEYVVGILTEAFALAQERGEVRPEVVPGSAARGLVALSDGLQVQWLLQPEAVDMALETRRYIQSLLATPLDRTGEQDEAA